MSTDVLDMKGSDGDKTQSTTKNYEENTLANSTDSFTGYDRASYHTDNDRQSSDSWSPNRDGVGSLELYRKAVCNNPRHRIQEEHENRALINRPVLQQTID